MSTFARSPEETFIRLRGWVEQGFAEHGATPPAHGRRRRAGPSLRGDRGVAR